MPANIRLRWKFLATNTLFFNAVIRSLPLERSAIQGLYFSMLNLTRIYKTKIKVSWNYPTIIWLGAYPLRGAPLE